MPTLATSLPALAAAGLTVLAPVVVPGAAHAAAAISCTVSGKAQYLPGAGRLSQTERSDRGAWNCVDRSGSGVTAAQLHATFNGVHSNCDGSRAFTSRGRPSGGGNAFDQVFGTRDYERRNLANRIIYDREGHNLADRIIHDRDEREMADRIVYDRERWGASDGVVRDRAASAGSTAPGGIGTVTIDWTIRGTKQTSRVSARIVDVVHDTAKVSGTIQSGPFRGKTFTGRFGSHLLGGSCVSGASGSVLNADFRGEFEVA
ncbi:hypothetical protein [Nonomuraea sp. NPDC001699]